MYLEHKNMAYLEVRLSEVNTSSLILTTQIQNLYQPPLQIHILQLSQRLIKLGVEIFGGGG